MLVILPRVSADLIAVTRLRVVVSAVDIPNPNLPNLPNLLRSVVMPRRATRSNPLVPAAVMGNVESTRGIPESTVDQLIVNLKKGCYVFFRGLTSSTKESKGSNILRRYNTKK